MQKRRSGLSERQPAGPHNQRLRFPRAELTPKQDWSKNRVHFWPSFPLVVTLRLFFQEPNRCSPRLFAHNGNHKGPLPFAHVAFKVEDLLPCAEHQLAACYG